MKREDSGHKHTHEGVSMESVRGAFAQAIIPITSQVKSSQDWIDFSYNIHILKRLSVTPNI